MHLKRVLSAAAFLPLFVLLVQFGTPLHLYALVSLAILVGLYEFFAMAEAAGLRPLTPLGLGGGLLLSAAQFFASPGPWVVATLALLVALPLVGLLMSVDGQKDAASRSGITLLGMFYVAGLLSFVALLRAMEGGSVYVLYLILVTWTGDTGAFYVGRAVGRWPLCPAISARKTVEGAVAGLVCSVLASWLASLWLWRALGPVAGLVLGCVLGVLGQLGDLCESLLKRSFGVKDAGALIPGHGGILDRVDSLLFTGPALYCAVLARWV
jgi:phosphatidate cytidylyltransferase